MSQTNPAEDGLENEITILRNLIQEANNEERVGLEQTLAALDSVADATPRLAAALKSQHELARGEQDPIEVLRQALTELEKEWAELQEVKEQLRGESSPAAAGEA